MSMPTLPAPQPLAPEQVALPLCPPGGPDPAELADMIGAWATSAALADLVRCFGGTPPRGTVGAVLDELDRFSDVWNYRRGGLERADATVVDYPDGVDDLVRAAAVALGLAGRGRPAEKWYDHVLILGGGPNTAQGRCHFAAGLLARSIDADEVSVLGSLRELGPGERAAAARLGLTAAATTPATGTAPGTNTGTGVDTEADVMAAGLALAFGTGTGGPGAEFARRDGVSAHGTPWWVGTGTAAGRTVHVIAAPSGDPARRANTADTLIGWAELVARPEPTHRLLVVTTDVFVPFQHCDAVRLLGLPYRCGVDTVGLDPGDFPTWLRPSQSSQVLQEVRSAIRSMRALYEASTSAHS
jgi:hypothetical protein